MTAIGKSVCGTTEALIDPTPSRCSLGPPPVVDGASDARIRVRAALSPTGLPGSGPDLEPWPADVLDRYHDITLWASGGMGRVYRARDRVLGRAVALKTFRVPGDGDSGRAASRMRREARALARLRSPYVVPIFAVHDGGRSLLIVMEFIEGQTATRWAEGQPASAIIEVFLRVGEALRDAHERGLVHRDVKPDNVIIGRDGRPRLVDFGLVRAAASDPAAMEVTASQRADERAGTETGQVMGTPAYMAPEQHFGSEDVGPAADQYAFCVSLWELLYEERPFVGETYEALARAKVRGVRALDRSAVMRVLVRGLSPDARRRWPSMEHLIRALESGHRPRRRAGALLFSGAALLSLAAVVRPSGASDCGLAPLPEIAEDQTRTWSSRIDRETATRLTARLLAFSERWEHARQQLCNGQVEPERSDAELACLRSARNDFEATLVTLDRMPLGMVDALALADRLPAGACDPSRAASTIDYTGRTLESQHAIEVVERGLAEARVLRGAARPLAAIERLRAIERDKNELDIAGLSLEWVLELGRAEAEAGEFALARVHSEEAYHLAGAQRRPNVAALAAIEIAFAVGDRGGDVDTAEQWLRHAGAVIDSASVTPTVLARYHNAVGHHEKSRGEFEEARQAYQRALSATRAMSPGDELLEAMMLSNLGALLVDYRRHEEALEVLVPALEIERRYRPPSHPDVAIRLTNLGIALHGLGRLEEAREAQEEALAAFRAAFGAHDYRVGIALTNLARTLTLLEDPTAEQTHRDALAVKEEAFGDDSPRLVSTLQNLAAHMLRDDRFGDAIAPLRRARRILDAANLQQHPSYVGLLVSLAGNEAGLRNTTAAVEATTQALAGLERLPELDSPDVAWSLVELARQLHEVGETDVAIAALTHAVSIYEAHPDVGEQAATARRELARARSR